MHFGKGDTARFALSWVEFCSRACSISLELATDSSDITIASYEQTLILKSRLEIVHGRLAAAARTAWAYPIRWIQPCCAMSFMPSNGYFPV